MDIFKFLGFILFGWLFEKVGDKMHEELHEKPHTVWEDASESQKFGRLLFCGLILFGSLYLVFKFVF